MHVVFILLVRKYVTNGQIDKASIQLIFELFKLFKMLQIVNNIN